MAGSSAATNLKSIVIGSSGNLIEWYDWYVYPNFAIYFSKVFFPHADQTTQLLEAALAFAVGFLMRPVGGWLMGLYADRMGRRPGLILSMVLMAVGSAGVGLIPGYAQIGFMAPVLLAVSRIVQGFSVGGQYAASASFLSEVAKQGHRGFWTSFHYVTLLMGLMLAQLILFSLQHSVTNAQITAWAWRVPFFIGAVLAIIAMLITLKVEESESFEKVQKRSERTNHYALLLKHWRGFVTVFVVTMAGTIVFQTYGTYMTQFLINTSGFTPAQSTEIVILAILVYTILHPFMGWLSDVIGRKNILIIFAATSLIVTIPVMSGLTHARDTTTAFWLLLLALTCLAPYTAVSAIFKSELFPTEIRAMAVGLSFALPVSIFGGTQPAIALWFKQHHHEGWYVWYMMGALALALIAALLMKRPDDATISGALKAGDSQKSA